jgi:hypothetical protein
VFCLILSQEIESTSGTELHSVAVSAGIPALPPPYCEGNTVFPASSILGELCPVLGRCVSARIAARQELLNGALASILRVGFGIWAVVKGAGHQWLDLFDLPLSPALRALGGYLRSRQTGRAG